MPIRRRRRGSTPAPSGSHVRHPCPCDVPAGRPRACHGHGPARAMHAGRPAAPRRESHDTMRPAAATLRIDLVAWSRAVAHAVFVCVGLWGETGSRRGARCSCRRAGACPAFGVLRGLAGGAAVAARFHGFGVASQFSHLPIHGLTQSCCRYRSQSKIPPGVCWTSR